MLILAFDTATETATCALVADGLVLGERQTTAAALLRDVEAIAGRAGLEPSAVDRIAVGRGPGRYTSLRMGLVTARMLSLALGAPVCGVSTLDALAAGAPGSLPLVDARRRELFALLEEPVCLKPDELEIERGRMCVGDGAVRYREILESAGGDVPPDDDPRHVPWARHHAFLAASRDDLEGAEPIYLRAPDADRALARNP
jgi:tRNA threonylcarbamoyladenosine biosynthesis protein TsaB